MKLDIVLEKINSSLDKLYLEYPELFLDKVQEETINFHFSNFLIPRFNDYKTHCEYNRSHKFKEDSGSTKEATFSDGSINKINPDILVFQRENTISNLLVLECKGYWNNSQSGKNKDIEVLCALTRTSLETAQVNFEGTPYGYKYGFHIVYGKRREDVKISKIKNGTKNLREI